MSYVVSLEDYVPPARADGVHFTQAIVEEAAAESGSWAALATLALSPPDADPSQPEPRELTVHNATLAEGWYRVVWADGAGNLTAPTPPIQNSSTAAGGLRPSVASVASLLRARTKVKGGKELGTFTTVTRPTSGEVNDLIDEASDEVLGKVQPPTAGSAYERRVAAAIRLYTAILIEGSYFPEEVKSGKSVAQTYQQLYASRIKSLIAEGETGRPQGEGGSGDAPGDAYWSFPDNGGGVIGWNTRF